MRVYCIKPTLSSVIISIQGVRGSFHEEIAQLLFGDTSLLERMTFDEVFNDASSGHCDLAIVAIENSIVGSLIYNYDRLAQSGLAIVAEAYLRVSHCLIASALTPLDHIREIWSHPMAIEQCRVFLRTLPSAKIIEKEDTAGSVKWMMEHDIKDVAAIASARSALLYKATILAQAIETDPHNYTRFLVLSKNKAHKFADTPNSKTSLLVRITDQPGSLHEILGHIKAFDINLSKIESRPRVGMPWKYDFYVDLEVDATTAIGSEVINEIQTIAESVTVLGSYPRLGVSWPEDLTRRPH